jgi:carbon dioxide concentrating mechanism protein CcmL
MKICRVIGNATASIKHPGLEGLKLLVVQEIDAEGQTAGRMRLAADVVGAGAGDLVALVRGAAAVRHAGRGELPCDAAVVAILDQVSVNDRSITPK